MRGIVQMRRHTRSSLLFFLSSARLASACSLNCLAYVGGHLRGRMGYLKQKFLFEWPVVGNTGIPALMLLLSLFLHLSTEFTELAVVFQNLIDGTSGKLRTFLWILYFSWSVFLLLFVFFGTIRVCSVNRIQILFPLYKTINIKPWLF